MAYYHRGSTHNTLARGLGWFSIGLGVTEVLAGRRLARWLGMEERSALIRAYGLREITAGVGLLSLGDPKPWMWGRVGGDALDIATLMTGFNSGNPNKRNVGMAIGAVMAVTAADLICVQGLHAEAAAAATPLRDYSDRRGLAGPPDDMRGAARDAPIADDMRTPKVLRYQAER